MVNNIGVILDIFQHLKMGNCLDFSETRKKRKSPTLALGMMKCNTWKGNTQIVCLIYDYFPAEEALGI